MVTYIVIGVRQLSDTKNYGVPGATKLARGAGGTRLAEPVWRLEPKWLEPKWLRMNVCMYFYMYVCMYG